VYEVLEDAETLEFSPREEMDKTMEAVSRNVEAMGSS
jgi:hypothetical protein